MSCISPQIGFPSSLKTIYTPQVTAFIISRALLISSGGKKPKLTMAPGCFLFLSIPLFQQFHLRDFSNNGCSLDYILKAGLAVGLTSYYRCHSLEQVIAFFFSSTSLRLSRPPGRPARCCSRKASAWCSPTIQHHPCSAAHRLYHMTCARWQDSSSYCLK